MTGLRSAIPAAITALLGHLNTIAATYTDPLSLVVIDGDIGTLAPPCYVEIGAAVNWKQEPAGLGHMRRNEEFSLSCLVQYFDGGAGAEVAATVRDAAFGVLEAIVLALDDDPTLGGAVRFAQIIGGPSMEQGTTGVGGWSVQVPFEVACEVQLER